VTERGSLQSQAMGEEVRYLIHLPPCYADYPDAAFPVLYLLHGWPLSEDHWLTLGASTVADDWVSRKIAGPFIVVMPGAGTDGLYVHSSGGDWSFEGMLVNELLPLVDSAYRTLRAPEGRAIGGISRGGVWSLEIALRHQDVFGSVGGHSPALALNNPLPQYDPFLIIRNEKPRIRIYLDAGDLDWARTSTARLYESLVEMGADVRFDTHAGAHVDELWQGGMLDYVAFYTAIWPLTYDGLPIWTPPPTPTPTP
jgi:enterochelin esterase-like enzyme